MSGRPAPGRRAWLALGTPAGRRRGLVLAVGLVVVGVALAAASLSPPPSKTAREVPLSTPPISQLDTTDNWSDATSPASPRLFVHVGTTAGYMEAGATTALCVHVSDDSDPGVEGASVEFEAASGTLTSPFETTDAYGRACTDFEAPDEPGQVVVAANATYGSLTARAWNTVEVVQGPAAPPGPDIGLLLLGATAAVLGSTLLAASTDPPSARERRLRAGRALIAWAVLLGVGALAASWPAAVPEGTDSHEHGVAAVVVEEASAVPVLAVGLVGLGTGAFAAGALLRARPKARPGRLALLAALTLLYLDGAVHWLAASEHAGIPSHQAFFLAVGGLQVAGAVGGIRSARLLWWAGAGLTWLLMALYIGTRAVAPVVPDLRAYSEPVNALGLVSKSVEIGLLLCLGLAFRWLGPSLAGRTPHALRPLLASGLAGAIARALKHA